MLNNCFWLPRLELKQDYDTEDNYCTTLYRIFLGDFINTHPVFDGQDVKVRYEPYMQNRIHTFYHIITVENGKNRVLDLDRCQRIRWVRAFIEHSSCYNPSCVECHGVRMWSIRWHSTFRIKILLPEERYLVVLEKRPRYVMLITAYYLDRQHSFDKAFNEYLKIQKQKAPQIIETPSETPSTLS